jgi:hypothetical protein
MELRFSVFARDRQFAKAMRRIRPRFASLADRFAKTELNSAVHKAVLVGITDDQGLNFFSEVPNTDGFFQVLAGCHLTEGDSSLAKQVFQILRRAAMACPLSRTDCEKVQEVF